MMSNTSSDYILQVHQLGLRRLSARESVYSTWALHLVYIKLYDVLEVGCVSVVRYLDSRISFLGAPTDKPGPQSRAAHPKRSIKAGTHLQKQK
jgi:hypothetical protein